uniref:Uncharacterized protein n=1 Tax=Anopheles albimanus TaxID=7167 RepID=A0A182F1G6_ANOAL
MLLPDQTYEQACLRSQHQQQQQQDHHRLGRLRPPPPVTGYDVDTEDDEFARLLALKKLEACARFEAVTVGNALAAGVLTSNDELHGKCTGATDGSGSSSGVGSAGDASGHSRRSQTQAQLDVRLPSVVTQRGERGGGGRGEEDLTLMYLDVESVSVWSNGQLRPTSPCTSSLSYSSDSSDDEGTGVAPTEDKEHHQRSTNEASPAADHTAADAMTERCDDYDRTSDFFNNIPEFQGEPLGPFSLAGKQTRPEPEPDPDPDPDADWASIRTNVDILRACELFLVRHRIRPDFFCKYKKAMNSPSASAPASFPLSRCSRTPITVRKPKSASPSVQRPASRAQRTVQAGGVGGGGRQAVTTDAPAPPPADRNGPGPIYSVPNRAGKKRRPNAARTLGLLPTNLLPAGPN